MNILDGSTFYRLSPSVRARPEKFGLLLYNCKDTNLTFIKSGNLLTIEPVDSSESFDSNGSTDSNSYFLKHHCKSSNEIEKIGKLLETLVKKGLILEVRSSI